MKEVFVNINDGRVKFIVAHSDTRPAFTGSEPFEEGQKQEVLGRVINMLVDLSIARKETWAFRINKQPCT